MATTYVYRTGTMAAGSTTTWTFSCWVKFMADGNYHTIFSQSDNTDDYTVIKMHNGDYIHWENAESVMNAELKTTRLLRDPGAWYNIVCVWDTTNDTSDDRMRIYVNGDRLTSFSSETQPPEDTDGILNKAGIGPMIIGATDFSGDATPSASQQYWDGNMSNVQFVDGAALAPTEFGEVDSTSGIWKIKTGAYSTPGTNGFFLKMEDRTNLDLDSSSNAHGFSTAGTGTATYDNPSNNFSTMNPLDNYYANSTFSNGNNTIATASSVYTWNTGTMGLGAGLWYFEIKIATGVTSNYHNIGVATKPSPSATIYLGDTNYSWAYVGNDGKIWTNTSGTAYGDTFTTGDIMGVYLDLTASKLYFAKNGTIQDSGTGFDITAVGSTDTRLYFPAAGDWGASYQGTFDFNFGNGYFGTTEITSPETDEGGIGAFKYNPSTGTFDGSSKDFRAICTKNIKLYGG